ncbi:MAG TPA: hypothetical protein VFH24_03840 [Gemmatimonadales bacterium]|nr:hypothetical protein [Gemmatimonadales bacterium]
MRSFALLGCLALLTGCSKAEDRSVGAADTSDTTAAPSAGTAEARPVSLRDFAGTWKVHSIDENGANPVDTEIRATGDTSGWTMIGPDRKTYPIRVVSVAGDSVITESGPRPSFVRKGAQVTTRTVYRLQGDKLVGRIESHFKIGDRDSTGQRTSEGTRIR